MNPNPLNLYERIGGKEGLAFLLKHFYADVRQHRLIGPIFIEHIQDWPSHLQKIGEFWARLTGGPSNFNGSLPIKHAPLGLSGPHFEAWLSLWEHNCRCHLGEQEANEMIQLANTIGKNLQAMVGEKKPGSKHMGLHINFRAAL